MLAFHQDPGDRIEIEGRHYYFERIDPDGAVHYRAPSMARYQDLMIDDADGHPRRPTTAQINALFASGHLILRGNGASIEQRRFAKAQNLDADQARAMDTIAEFRIAVARYCDKYCTSLSDQAMEPVIAAALAQPAIRKINPKELIPHPSTVRRHMKYRGKKGKRKLRHGMSRVGRYERKLVSSHPSEILLYWLLSAGIANDHGQIANFHEQYEADLYKISNGIPLNRKLLTRDDEGLWVLSEHDAVYDQPATPYKGISYSTFWRRYSDERTPRLFGLATTEGGKRSRYGGGGRGERPSFGSLCEIDETLPPYIFLVDENTGIPMGTATLTLMLECSVKALVGWDLCAQSASSSTLLRTVRHANSIKNVPPDLLAKFPDLGHVRLKPDRIKCDNSPGAHSHHFEDACAEAYITIEWTGRASPTHKSLVERTIGTILHTLFKKLPGHNYDIALMRKYGFKPDEQVLCTLSKARELLDRACFTYNITGHSGL